MQSVDRRSDRIEAAIRRQGADGGHQESWVRRDARPKVLACLAIVVLVAWAPPPRLAAEGWQGLSAWHALVALLLIAAIWRARGHLMDLARSLARIVCWIAIWAALIPAWQGFAGGWGLAAAVAVKGVLSATAIVLLVNTTSPQRLLLALARMRVPRPLVAILGAMGRYLHVLMEELVRMRRAESARSFGKSVSWRRLHLTRAGWLVGILLVRASGRAERVHAAMLARGYDGRVRTLDECP